MSVHRHLDSHLGWIVIDDPAGGNVLNTRLITDVHEALDAFVADDDCRVIALTGRDGVFCSGLDFASLASEGNTDATKAGIDAFATLLLALRNAPKTVLGVVNGIASGGGVGLAAACDWVFATYRAGFIMSEVLFGLIPQIILPFVRDRIGLHHASALALTTQEVWPEDALRIGLCDEVVPADGLPKAIRRMMKGLMRTSPAAVGTLKRYTAAIADLPTVEALAMAKQQFAEWIADSTHLQVIRNYVQNAQSPPWFGRYKPEDTIPPSPPHADDAKDA